MAAHKAPNGALDNASANASAQSCGVLLVVDLQSFEILKATQNSAAHFGVPAAELVTLNLNALVGVEAVDGFRDIFGNTGSAANPSVVHVNGLSFTVVVHISNGAGIVEFEPVADATHSPSAASVYGAFHRLASATNSHQLWADAAREVRTITGFDRVMVYQFLPDGRGEVAADDHAPDLESYLGWQYPASDIPTRTFSLYRTVLSRTIVDSAAAPTALLSREGDTGVVDLSHAQLCMVSEHHLRFMRTMGQASSLSFSLVHNGDLVGMITCVNRTPLWAPFSLRQGLEILANQLALHISSMIKIEALSRLVHTRSICAALLAQVQESDDFAQSLTEGRLTMLTLVEAESVAVSLGGVITAGGSVPSYLQLSFVVDYLRDSGITTTFVSDALAHEHPQLAEILPEVAGLMMISLGRNGFAEGNYLAWFRREVVHSIRWIGDQAASSRRAAASVQLPQSAGNSWRESIHGTSNPWLGLEVEAAELGRGLESALLVRVESKLADLALRDSLTGLPNRRLFMDRLEHALTKYARGSELALLFIDLDGVNAVNIGDGHSVGDSVIIDASVQIAASVRAQDTLARFGGDEFVVLCENTTGEEAIIVANRILTAIRSSGRDGIPAVTASIGLATARFNFSAFDLLGEATAALERAKARGKNVVSQ